MRELFVYYARCNRKINQTMLDLLHEKVESPFERALDGYHFRTLGQLLEHLWVADMLWMKAFEDLESYGLSLVGEVAPLSSYGEKVFADFASYRSARARLDDFICRFMERVDETLFSKTVSRKTRAGVLLERQAPLALVHFFNHQTHHRGQVSALLDLWKVENDYSNMIFLEVEP